MRSLKVNCGKCKTSPSFPLTGPSIQANCPACGTGTLIEVFPALINPPAPGQSGEKLLIDDQSSCFYHPSKKAVIPCESCGRFLCSLCDIEFNGRHLCSTCIESGAKKGKIVQMRRDTTYYDDIAIALAILPILIFYFTIITAPIAMYIAIRYWNAPLSAAPRGKWRFVVAIVFASLQIIGWGFGILALMGGILK